MLGGEITGAARSAGPSTPYNQFQAVSAGKTLFAYLGAGCPFRTDWGATSFNVSQ